MFLFYRVVIYQDYIIVIVRKKRELFFMRLVYKRLSRDLYWFVWI